MTLAKPIYQGTKLILQTGVAGIPKYKEKLNNVGIFSVYVNDPVSDDISVPDVVCEQTREKCKATFAVCLPSFILVLIISYYFARFKNNKYVEAAFTGLRPATVGLIAAAALLLVNAENFIDAKSVLIFIGSFILTWKYKMHPILMIFIAGIAGIILYW